MNCTTVGGVSRNRQAFVHTSATNAFVGRAQRCAWSFTSELEQHHNNIAGPSRHRNATAAASQRRRPRSRQRRDPCLGHTGCQARLALGRQRHVDCEGQWQQRLRRRAPSPDQPPRQRRRPHRRQRQPQGRGRQLIVLVVSGKQARPHIGQTSSQNCPSLDVPATARPPAAQLQGRGRLAQRPRHLRCLSCFQLGLGVYCSSVCTPAGS